MTVSNDLYRSWRSEGSYFSAMLNCGERYNQWVEIALQHLPPEVLDECKEQLVFVSTADRDGCRLARKYCEEREVILLSERILPKKGASLGDQNVRYFVFVVLHEIVHAVKRHRSPKFDSLSESDNEEQEEEADLLAFEWFNAYVKAQDNPYMKPLTTKELEESQAKSRERMNDQYNGE